MGFNSAFKGLIFLTVFSTNYANIKFRKIPSSENRVDPCGRKDGRTDMTMPIFAFRNFAKASQNISEFDNFSIKYC